MNTFDPYFEAMHVQVPYRDTRPQYLSNLPWTTTWVYQYLIDVIL